jgi:phytoene dehydrogenase-like protein
MKQFQLPLSKYALRFKHPAIRQALISFLPENNSAYILPYNMGVISSGSGGRPQGGSRTLAFRMMKKYISTGGNLHLGKEVKSIQIQKGSSTGILLSDGSTVTSDYVVPAMDIHMTLNNLLNGKYPNPKINQRDTDPLSYPALTCVYASFGIDADISEVPDNISFLGEPYLFEGRERNLIPFRHYCYEPTFAPYGKSIGIIQLYADYDWWKNKHENLEEYKNEKKRLSEVLCEALEKRFPQLKGKIIPLDVATPITYERYCGAWRGAWMTYGTTPYSKQMIQDGRIKGIDNLFMAGQWLMPPGGLTIAMLTGKWAIQRLCKKEKLSWRW